jgi:hypothetical protein
MGKPRWEIRGKMEIMLLQQPHQDSHSTIGQFRLYAISRAAYSFKIHHFKIKIKVVDLEAVDLEAVDLEVADLEQLIF